MTNMLITGGAGFIGANFVHYWRKHYPEDNLIVLDALTYAGNRSSIQQHIESNAITFIKGSICDSNLIEDLLLNHNIDTIVNFAAESHVDRSITGPDAFIDTNIIGTYALLKAAHKIWIETSNNTKHRFHHISTDEVFGSLEPNDPAFTESNQYLPNSPYSASKAASDHLVRAYHHTYGLNVTTSNCSNNYGPYHFPEKLIPLCITNLLEGKSLPIYGDGKNIRDWLYVEDHCRGIDLVLKKGTPGETYNIGGVNEWDNLSLVELVCDIIDGIFSEDPQIKQQYPKCPTTTGRTCRESITFVKDRLGHDKRYAIATDRIRNDLGYEPTVTFEQGIRKTIYWYLENEAWWRPLLAK